MKKQGTKTAKKKTTKVEKPETSEKMVTIDDIRRRAFEIYLENEGSSDELENWVRAENELKEDFS